MPANIGKVDVEKSILPPLAADANAPVNRGGDHWQPKVVLVLAEEADSSRGGDL
jgi:hypothetical protein